MKQTKLDGIKVPVIPTIEKTDSRCVMLKQKEYDELVRLSKENRSKEIFVKYSYSNYGLNVSGDFELKGGIKKQIFNIFSKISEKAELSYIERSQKLKIETKVNTRNYINDQFMELPWYKRLFFKKEYIN